MENMIIDGFIRKGGMVYVSESEYDGYPDSYKGVWDVERWDIADWESKREKYIGKRTIMPPFALFGHTCLMIEGIGMEIVSDEKFNKIASEL